MANVDLTSNTRIGICVTVLIQLLLVKGFFSIRSQLISAFSHQDHIHFEIANKFSPL